MKSIYSIFILLALAQAGGVWANDSADLGRKIGKQIIRGYNSPDKIRKNAIAPMTGGADIPAPDGSTPPQDPPHTPCPSSKKALSVKVGVTIGGGDISGVTLRQDTDMDGIIDSTYSTPRVSGVCSAGIISCNPGSWDNCRYYRWNADMVSGKLSLESALPESLGECYCVNNSCAPNVVANHLMLITRDLGKGAVEALRVAPNHAVHPLMAVATAMVTPGSAVYYAQDMNSDTCKDTTQDYAENHLTTNPGVYYFDPKQLNDDASALDSEEVSAPEKSMRAQVKQSGKKAQTVTDGNNDFETVRKRMEKITTTTTTVNGGGTTGSTSRSSRSSGAGPAVAKAYTMPAPSSAFTLYYQDINGSQHQIGMAAQNTYGEVREYDTACEVRNPAWKNTQAAPAGHIGLFRFSVTEPWSAVRRCVDNVCPVKAGEEIVQDCSRIDKFRDAITAVSLIEATKRTVICSSGTKR